MHSRMLSLCKEKRNEPIYQKMDRIGGMIDPQQKKGQKKDAVHTPRAIIQSFKTLWCAGQIYATIEILMRQIYHIKHPTISFVFRNYFLKQPEN